MCLIYSSTFNWQERKVIKYADGTDEIQGEKWEDTKSR